MLAEDRSDAGPVSCGGEEQARGEAKACHAQAAGDQLLLLLVPRDHRRVRDARKRDLGAADGQVGVGTVPPGRGGRPTHPPNTVTMRPKTRPPARTIG